ncbi:hypothetical protein [Jannaschia rubra]|uniref:hypothetical protein n=1 Tax=Jannaschia rubra TaxID=282197 RepID=UPI00249266D3|nr:hypothetical protein [Jannaschia rubra]
MHVSYSVSPTSRTVAQRVAEARLQARQGRHHLGRRHGLTRRPAEALPFDEPGWTVDATLDFLSRAVRTYSATGSFGRTFDTSDFYAIRAQPDGAIRFRHVDGALFGTVEDKKASLTIVGGTATSVVKKALALICRTAGGRPQLARVQSGPRLVHLASMMMSAERRMRFACFDATVRDRDTGIGRPAATLLLRPLAAPVLILRNPIALPHPA